MSVTIKQIAEYAGVSRGTVDRALNNRDGINPTVAKRIKKIAQELGYTPNRAGKALASKKNPIQIGVILNSIGNTFFDDVIKGIKFAQEEYRDFSLNVHLIELKGYDVNKQLEKIDELVEKNVNAIVLTPINDEIISSKINELTNNNISVIKLNSDLENTKDAVYIGCDYEKSGATSAGLLRLFRKENNTNIGIITGSVKMLGHNQRIKGFLNVCKKDFENANVVEIVENNDDNDISYEVTKQLITEHKVNALYFCAGGVIGGIKAVDEICKENRPIIICCDDTPEIKELLMQDKINATVCQQPFNQGYESIKSIFNKLMVGEFNFKELYMQNEIKIKYNI